MNTISGNPLLTEEQKHFLFRLRESELRNRFYLTGGTALAAFYLQHRLSEDLDFFSGEAIAVEEILAFLKSLTCVSGIDYQHKFDRRMFTLQYPSKKSLKVEFTLYPFPACEDGVVVENIGVDSLRDILANKLMAMTDRRDAKDYVDLYIALKANTGMDIDRLLGDAERKFGITGLEHILQGRFLEALPPLGILKMLEQPDTADIAEFFKSQARIWIARSGLGNG